MARVHLRIDHGESQGTQRPGQHDKCRFRGVGLHGEHRFSEKTPAQRHAVQSACEDPIAPRLDGMSVSKLMEMAVRIEHLVGNPGPVLAPPFGVFTSGDHIAK